MWSNAAAFLIGLIAFFLYPHVMTQGWEWFVVPLGVPEITYWQAMGLGMFIYSLTRRPQSLAEEHARAKQTVREKEQWLLVLSLTSLIANLSLWAVMAIVRWIPT